MEDRIRIKHSAIAAGLGLATLGIFFFFVGIQYESDHVALSERGETTLAEVTAVDQEKEGSDTYYRLQYEFKVDGESYTRTDITGETDQWIELSKAAWDEANSTGTIPVHYLPEDPAVNWPEQAIGDPLRIGYVTEGLGAAMIALLLGLIARMAAEYRRVKTKGAEAATDCIMVEVKEESAS